MSSIFGQTVDEPPFDVLLERNQGVDTTYELRKYGKRFAATCTYSSQCLEKHKMKVTAPVVTQNNGSGEKVMKFMLPVEYDELSEIPKPLDPSVTIEEIQPQTGAVHRYNGSWDENRNKGIALGLSQQLIHDGVNITEDYVLDHWQFWGYNPPFTIPYFRRNEIWIELNSEQVDYLVENYSIEAIGKVGVLAMASRPLFSCCESLGPLGVGGLAILACMTAVFVIKSRRSWYSRLG